MKTLDFLNRSCSRHYCKIQDYPEDWYQQFHLVVCGLDSIVARRWINQTLVSLLNYTVDGLDEVRYDFYSITLIYIVLLRIKTDQI